MRPPLRSLCPSRFNAGDLSRPGLDVSPSSWPDGGYGGGYGDAVSVCDSSWAGSDVTERYDDTLVDILSQVGRWGGVTRVA